MHVADWGATLMPSRDRDVKEDLAYRTVYSKGVWHALCVPTPETPSCHLWRWAD